MLSAYGLPLGDAFQMRDDMLGAFGDSALTGKPVGGDFIEGKPTPLLSRAYEAANTSQREVLDEVGREYLSAQDIARIQQVVQETGAVSYMEDRIASLTHSAIGALDKNALSGDAYFQLVDLASAVTSRTH